MTNLKTITAIALTIVATSAAVATAEAAPRQNGDRHVIAARFVATPLIDQRIENQQRRIATGVRNGALTRFETIKLGSRLNAIKGSLMLAKVDGNVSPAERRYLLDRLDTLSQDIFEEKHDRQNRAARPAGNRYWGGLRFWGRG